jgi:hypothetical protein
LKLAVAAMQVGCGEQPMVVTTAGWTQRVLVLVQDIKDMLHLQR